MVHPITNINGAVYGGGVDNTGNAMNNTVTINGGTINIDVYGGSTFNGNATGNTVSFSGTPVLSGDIYGGYDNSGGDMVSGNTLEVRNIGLKAKNVYNFEKYHFYLPETVQAGDTALTLTDPAGTDLTQSTNGAAITPKVGVAIAGGAALLKEGDRINLLRNDNGLTSTGYQEVSLKGQQGVSLEYDFTLGADANTLYATVTKVPDNAKPQMKAISEANLAGMALALQGANLIAGQGMRLAAGAGQPGVFTSKETSDAFGLGVFGAIPGGAVRYNTGSHVDMHSFSLLTGLTLGKGFALGHFTLGAFFEYGNGSYDTHNSFANAASVNGDGDNWYMGGGLLARMDFAPTGPGHAYLEASARAGSLHNDYDGSNELRDENGRKASFENSTPYYGLHLGTGYIWQPVQNLDLDLFAKYFWTHQGSDSVTLATDEKVHFDSINSHRLRLGARADYALNEYITPYIGAAWEYEFDGKAKAQVHGRAIAAPDLKGSTGIGEIGLTLTPSASIPLSFDLGAQGYVGKREGITGSLKISYEF